MQTPLVGEEMVEALVEHNTRLEEKCRALDEELRMSWSRIEQLMACPIEEMVKKRPMKGICENVHSAVFRLAWDYSMGGVEGVRGGHILIIGPPGDVLAKGAVKGKRGSSWVSSGGNITEEDDRADVLEEMNLDGAHIIDPRGQIIASKFFSSEVDNACLGGSGHGAASRLSLIPGCVVFKISASGSISEFRNGEKTTICGPRCMTVSEHALADGWELLQ
jgi:hypothetical protein